ncbi:hypothetical protein L2X67_15465 [Enterobacter ludwigii]|nr:hypothetical protein [Enterobacter ludwigii]
MKKDELVVRSLLSELLGDTLNYYIDNLSDLSKSNGDEDPYSRARSVIHKLFQEEQGGIFNFLRLVIVDITSTVLGTIDGSHFPPNIDGDFKLEYDGDEIKGSLQDELISRSEELGIYK